MPHPKRHHFVPEFYLRSFARDGLLYVFDREKAEYRRQPPRNTAVIGHYYATMKEDGEKDYGVEHLLSRIEGLAKPVIEKLDEGRDIGPEERVRLSYFLAFLFNRVPKFEREIDQIADSAAKLWLKHMFPTVESVEAYFASTEEDRECSAPDFLDFIQNEEYELVGNRNNTVHTMLEQTPKIAQSLAMMAWDVMHCDDRSAFITTDSPFGLLLSDEQRASGAAILGVGSPEITKAVPITKGTALLIRGAGVSLSHYRLNREQVREVNVAVAAECERYIFGPDEALVRSVVRRSHVDTSKPATRLRVEHVPHPTEPERTITIVRRVLAEAPNTPIKIPVGD